MEPRSDLRSLFRSLLNLILNFIPGPYYPAQQITTLPANKKQIRVKTAAKVLNLFIFYHSPPLIQIRLSALHPKHCIAEILIKSLVTSSSTASFSSPSSWLPDLGDYCYLIAGTRAALPLLPWLMLIGCLPGFLLGGSIIALSTPAEQPSIWQTQRHKPNPAVMMNFLLHPTCLPWMDLCTCLYHPCAIILKCKYHHKTDEL